MAKHKSGELPCPATALIAYAKIMMQLMLSGKFIDTINIFNRKRNAVRMNESGFAKIFYEQIDEIL